MTCIVGIVDGGTVTIGGDSAGNAGNITQHRADPKVFTTGPYVIGYTSSFRMGQLLRYAFTPPEPPADATDLHAFMCTEFVDAVREALKAGGWATKDFEQEAGGTFLVGVDGHLFEIHSDYQVGQMGDGYTAIGCGEQFALGSLHATDGYGRGAGTRVREALLAAAHFSTGVRPPFTIVSTGDQGDSEAGMSTAPEPHPHDPPSATTTTTGSGAVVVTIDGAKLYDLMQQHATRHQRRNGRPTSLKLDITPGRLPVLTVTPVVFDSDVSIDGVRTRVPPAMHDLLTRLGWTPPGEQT